MNSITRALFSVSVLFLSLLFATSSVTAQMLGQQSLSQSSYVIDKQGKLYTWGLNHDGQLGIGSTTDQNIPVQVALNASITKWVLVAGGARHSMAVGDSDKLFCWGNNADGELGNGSTTSQSTPVRVANPPGVRAWKWVSAGADHSLALSKNGLLYAWGGNAHGQLGVGDNAARLTPTQVPFPSGVTGWSWVAAGASVTLAIATNGQLYAWGLDTSDHFKLPNRQISTPYPVVTPAPLRRLTELPPVGVSADRYEVITNHRSIFGTEGQYTDPNLYPAEVTVGGEHEAALWADGSLMTWGDNTYGQLGNGSNSPGPSTVALPQGVTQWVAVAAGLQHTIAIANDGNVYSWGDNRFGSLGLGTIITENTPQPVAMFGDPVRMTAKLSAPPIYSGMPFIVNVTVTDNTNETLLGGDAYLTIDPPVKFSGSDPDQDIFPYNIFPGNPASAQWTLNADSLTGSGDWIPYYAYVREAGSSPILVSGRIFVGAKSPVRFITNTIRDAQTQTGIPNVLIYARHNPGGIDTLYTDANGTFKLRDSLSDFYVIQAFHENFETRTFIYSPDATADTLKGAFALFPSQIEGTFQPTAITPIAKTYFPDSLIGYGITNTSALRTSDGGKTWTRLTGITVRVHDLFFKNKVEGWIVGDGGSIQHTVNSGASWQTVPNDGRLSSFRSICGAQDKIWIATDSGTVLQLRGNKTIVATSRLSPEPLNAVHFFDSTFGVAVGNKGTVLLYNGKWSRLAWDTTNDFTTVYANSPVSFVAAGTRSTVVRYVKGVTFPLGLAVVPPIQNVIHSLYFIDRNTGFAIGDSGANFVTYDSGQTFARLNEITKNVASINFFGLAGRAVGESTIWTYNGISGPRTATIHGRVLAADGITGIAGVPVVVFNALEKYDTAWTNESGNYVMEGLPAGNQSVTIAYSDSTGTESIDTSLSLAQTDIATVNLQLYSHADADEDLVNESGTDAISNVEIYPNPAVSASSLSFEAMKATDIRIALYDARGVSVMPMISLRLPAGVRHIERLPLDKLNAGIYYYRIIAGETVKLGTISVIR